MFKTSSNWNDWAVMREYCVLTYRRAYGGPGCYITVTAGQLDVTVHINGTYYCSCQDMFFARQIADMYAYTHGGWYNETEESEQKCLKTKSEIE